MGIWLTLVNQISQPGESDADFMVTGTSVEMGFAAPLSAAPGEALKTGSA